MSESNQQTNKNDANDGKDLNQSDTRPDGVSTTDKTDISSELEGEENKPLDPEADAKAEAKKVEENKAKEQRDKQISTWSERYYNGEIKLEEAPEWIQKEIKKADKETGDDIDKRVDQRLAAQRDGEKYKSLTDKINDTNLSPEQRQKLIARYKSLRKHGVPQGEALETAIDAAGVTFEKKESPSAPKTSGKDPERKDDPNQSYSELRKNMTPEQRADYLEKQTEWQENDL